MTNIQSKSLIPFCKFIDKSVIHVSIFYMHCVRQLLIHFLYIDGKYSQKKYICLLTSPLCHALQHEIINLIYLFIYKIISTIIYIYIYIYIYIVIVIVILVGVKFPNKYHDM